MKVVLNSIITDLDDNVITRVRFQNNTRLESPLKLCSLLYDKLSKIRVVDPTEISKYFTLMTKMHEVMLQEAETTCELTQEEYDICLTLLENEDLIIKARFVESVVE